MNSISLDNKFLINIHENNVVTAEYLTEFTEVVRGQKSGFRLYTVVL